MFLSCIVKLDRKDIVFPYWSRLRRSINLILGLTTFIRGSVEHSLGKTGLSVLRLSYHRGGFSVSRRLMQAWLVCLQGELCKSIDLRFVLMFLSPDQHSKGGKDFKLARVGLGKIWLPPYPHLSVLIEPSELCLTRVSSFILIFFHYVILSQYLA